MNLLQMLGMAMGGQGLPDYQTMSGWSVPEDGGPMPLNGPMAASGRPMDERAQRRPVGMGNPLEHKSPLGIGGRARDILGGLGDALLIGTGNKARYEPKRDRERLQDAMQGIDMNDPQAVFERIAQEDPEMALKFMQASSLANYRNEGLDIRRDDLGRKVNKDALTAEDKIVQGLGGYANSIDNDDKLARFREIANRRLAPYELTADDVGIPQKYTPGVMQDWAQNGIPLYKQRMLEQGDARIKTGERNADSNRIKADAAASNAASTAAQVPGKIANTQARTGLTTANTDRVYGRNGTIQTGTRPDNSLLGGTPSGGGLPPGVRASRSATDKIRLSDGTKLLGDGKGGWINKGK